MLNFNPETVCFIIERAHKFHANDTVDVPDASELPPDTNWDEWLAPYEEDPVLAEFLNGVADLEPDQQAELVALMWLGRGDYGVDDWEDAIAEAQANWTSETGRYLISTPLVADYLTEGLSLLDYTCEV